MTDTPEPYSKKTYRVPFLLDIHANNERQAFDRLNRIVRLLADRSDDTNLAQTGYEARKAREVIMGAAVYVDQLREVKFPATPHPLPTIDEMLQAMVPPAYRNPTPEQMRFSDAGQSSDIVPRRGSAAE